MGRFLCLESVSAHAEPQQLLPATAPANRARRLVNCGSDSSDRPHSSRLELLYSKRDPYQHFGHFQIAMMILKADLFSTFSLSETRFDRACRNGRAPADADRQTDTVPQYMSKTRTVCNLRNEWREITFRVLYTEPNMLQTNGVERLYRTPSVNPNGKPIGECIDLGSVRYPYIPGAMSRVP